jgi:hypothetical protein
LVPTLPAGAQLQFLPAYSPDLNPIEQAFAKLKALLRPARTVFGVSVTFAELCEHATLDAFDRMVGRRRGEESQNAKRAESAAVRGN